MSGFDKVVRSYDEALEGLTDGMTVSDTFYLKPRRSTQVLRQ